MAVARYRCTITAADGIETEVIADQRDVVKFERDEKINFNTAVEQMATALSWCLAYYASKRTGVIDGKVSRDEWEAGVVQVDLVVDEPVNPGNPEASEDSP